MTPGIRVHVVMPPSLVEGVDAARGEGQSRGDWVRRAVERALEGLDHSPRRVDVGDRDPVPAPAEQPRAWHEEITQKGTPVAVSPPKPISPRVPFRRDVKPFQRGGSG